LNNTQFPVVTVEEVTREPINFPLKHQQYQVHRNISLLRNCSIITRYFQSSTRNIFLKMYKSCQIVLHTIIANYCLKCSRGEGQYWCYIFCNFQSVFFFNDAAAMMSRIFLKTVYPISVLKQLIVNLEVVHGTARPFIWHWSIILYKR